jgi:hypothetical protein
MWMLAIFDVLSKDEKSVFSLRWTHDHDSVNYLFSEFNITIFLKAISQELEKSTGFVWNSLVKKLSGFDDLNFEINTKIW